jgi:uncharacterized protein YjbJ (UPF0337 family)
MRVTREHCGYHLDGQFAILEEPVDCEQRDQSKGATMSDKYADEGKGRLEEAVGSLTGDSELKKEGKADQAKASIKDKVDKAAEKVKGALDGGDK